VSLRKRAADAFWRWIGEDDGTSAIPEDREQDAARVEKLYPTKKDRWDVLLSRPFLLGVLGGLATAVVVGVIWIAVVLIVRAVRS
jgi:hypothetical protein